VLSGSYILKSCELIKVWCADHRLLTNESEYAVSACWTQTITQPVRTVSIMTHIYVTGHRNKGVM